MAIFELNIFWLIIAPTYYGLMYVFAFIACYLTVKKSLKIEISKMDDLLLYCFIGVILWWRIFYILFYDLNYYINNPFDLIKTWQWWMSFHWWAVWVIVAMYFFAKKYWISYLKLADQVCRSLPIWLFFWRIWNYLNNELLWFSNYNWFLSIEKSGVYYFPSSLLEAFLEWIILFLILNLIYYKYKKFDWQVATLFLIFYAIFRIFVEIFFRQPDIQIWYIFWVITMWEILTLPMFFVWIYLFFKLRNNKLNNL